MKLIRLLAFLSFAMISLTSCAYVAGWKDSVEQDKIAAKEAKTNKIKAPSLPQKPVQNTNLPNQNPNVTAGKMLNPITQ